METKVCKKCGRELPISRFSKSKNTEDGYKHECKACRGSYSKEWRANKLKEQDSSVETTEVEIKPVLSNTKVCVRCGKELPIVCFGKDERAKSGYRGACRKCETEYMKNWRKNKIEQIKNAHVSEFKTEELISELKRRMSTITLIKKLMFS